LNLNVNLFASGVSPSSMSVTAWNWFENSFTSSHRFTCWERIPIDSIDARLTFGGPFGANYGQIRFVPTPAGVPQLLGAIEQVTTVGRTIRNMIHNGMAATGATFTTDQ